VENPGGSQLGDRKKVQIWTRKKVACGHTLTRGALLLFLARSIQRCAAPQNSKQLGAPRWGREESRLMVHVGEIALQLERYFRFGHGDSSYQVSAVRAQLDYSIIKTTILSINILPVDLRNTTFSPKGTHILVVGSELFYCYDCLLSLSLQSLNSWTTIIYVGKMASGDNLQLQMWIAALWLFNEKGVASDTLR
jgi:hypothetical protein